MKYRIWLSPPHLSDAELEHVKDAFSQNWIAPIGPQLAQFENKLSHFLNGAFVTALNSGTSALHLALQLLGVGKGDEVICSSFTFAASAFPITYTGATPVFIDSEPETWNMDPDLLEEALKDRLAKGKKVGAIIVVHLYGMPAKMDEIIQIARKYDVPLIEDAAESLGSTYKNKQTGTLGHIGIFSFNGNKIITTSAGGAIVSSDEAITKKALFLATQAKENLSFYEHQEIGYNYRMSNVLAAVGIGQMDVLAQRVEQRRNNFMLYHNFLQHISEIAFQQEPDNCKSNRWLTCLTFRDGDNVEKVRLSLQQLGIESRVLWKPMHLQPVFKDCVFYGSGVSDRLFSNGLCLPSGSALLEGEIEEISAVVQSFF
jgi:dTDP-4-amino-4,6-dideoxygalactose transaminase